MTSEVISLESCKPQQRGLVYLIHLNILAASLTTLQNRTNETYVVTQVLNSITLPPDETVSIERSPERIRKEVQQ